MRYDLKPRKRKVHGDPRTTGNYETASQRRKRKEAAKRVPDCEVVGFCTRPQMKDKACEIHWRS